MGELFHFAWNAEGKGLEYFHAIHFLRATVILGATLVIWLVGARL